MIFQTDHAQGFNCYSSHYDSNAQQPKRRGLKSTHKSLIIWHVLVTAYFLFNSFAKGDQIPQKPHLVDMSHVFDNTTIYWVTEPPLKLNVTYNGTLPGKNYWYQKDEIYAATHGGTHLDAPCHFAKGRWCVSDIPLDRLVVPAVVIDISANVNGNPDVHLTTDHLLNWEKEHGQIPDGSLLLVNTGWSKFWPDPLTYSGTAERVKSDLRFPSIHGEAAKWMASNRNVVGVGLDVMSLDIPNSTYPITHVTLMEKNIYGLENVNNIDLLPPTGAMVYVMPMKLRYASGAPCRIVAQLPDGPSSNASGYSLFSASFVWILAAVLGFIVLTWT